MNDPHTGQIVLRAGPPLEQVRAALILIHGRGASAQGMLDLYGALRVPQMAALAPQAAQRTWYPESFLAPLNENQPWLDSALSRIDSLLQECQAHGLSSEQVALLGFSQGACLVLEFVARYPRRYGAVIGLTGGLIGPPGTPRQYTGSLQGTPIFLGSGDSDPHVPFERVLETQAVLTQMDARVELRRYPAMPHTINDDEMQAARSLLLGMLKN